jgi:uncharacterized protein (TIGR02996 family)
MDVKESLLQEVLSHPEKDEPRLVFADWLEDQGDPRAEFIRLQCEIAQLPPTDDDVAEMQHRATLLLSEHEREWVGDIADQATSWTFHRGFVEIVQLTADRFLDSANELFERAPIQCLHLTDTRRQIGSIAKCAYLKQLKGLIVEDTGLGDDGLTTLANSRYIAQMSRFILSNCGITNKGVVALVSYSNMHDLRLLDLSRNTIRTLGVQALSASPLARNLEVLLLGDNMIPLPGAKHLANSNYFRNLQYLDIRSNPVPHAGVQLLRDRFGRQVCDA